MRPIFHGLKVVVLTGFHCIIADRKLKLEENSKKHNKPNTIPWPSSQVYIIERMTSLFMYFTKQIGFVRSMGQNFS